MRVEVDASVVARARVHAALGDPARLAIVDALAWADCSPGELGRLVGAPTNLLAHHLQVLESAGVIVRGRSEGDRRRSYVRLVPAALAGLAPAGWGRAARVVFVCTHNSARSQFAAALWARSSRVPVASAGTDPAGRVHPRAVAVARRHGLSLGRTRPIHADEVVRPADVVVGATPRAGHRTGEGSAMTNTEPAVELTVDQQLAMRMAAARLADEFDGVFGQETIERFLYSSYDQFADRSTIAKFLPLLAERFARQRLRALARVEGLAHDRLPVVLFLCVHNSGRSQMAMAFFQHLAGDRAVAWSGGSEPGNEVNPAAVAAMAEVGVDISGEFPKPWTDEIVRAADVVITMGYGDSWPVFPGKRYLDWTLEDPAGLGVDAVRPIRDEIQQRVRGLLAELGVSTAA